MANYELTILGAPSDAQLNALREALASGVEPFGLRLGDGVGWSVLPDQFAYAQGTPSAVAFFGAPGAPDVGLSHALKSGVPVLPIVSDLARVTDELPAPLRPINSLAWGADGAQRTATVLLECVGLLRRQRRVFVSYRRAEALSAAPQLADALSARGYDVFLDTHRVAPADDFQAVLWHRLCDADVLLMLDTAEYFVSRWTDAEFGRALSKGISVLRVGWPNVTASPRAATAAGVELSPEEVTVATGRLTEAAVDRIGDRLEAIRSRSQAVRDLNLYSTLKMYVERVGGEVTGVGPHKAIYARMPSGRDYLPLVVFPVTGVPTSQTLQDAAERVADSAVAVAYDHVGLLDSCTDHLTWLGKHITQVRWLKVREADWELAGWRV
jgi:hypothetical protein